MAIPTVRRSMTGRYVGGEIWPWPAVAGYTVVMTSRRHAKPAEPPEEPPKEPPDAAALARRYVDLWQEEFTAIAADPSVSDQLTRWFTSLGQNLADPASWLTGMTAAFSGDPGAVKQDDVRPRAGTATRTASAGTASDGGADDVAQLARRINALERKLESLAEDAGGKAGGSVGRTRAPRRRPAP